MNAKIKKPGKKNIEDILALTPMQEGMLFHYLKDPESDHYFEQLSLEISGKINVEFFEKAWDYVVRTNEMLRTAFRWEMVERPVQIIYKEHAFKPLLYDFSNLHTRQADMQLEELRIKDRENSFDLREVPFRVILCKVWEERWEIVVSNHHILYDGWSSGIILKEFFDAYYAAINGREPVKAFKTGFKEYIKWNRDPDLTGQEQFWREYLKGFDVQTVLPVKRRTKQENRGTGNYRLGFETGLKNRLTAFVKKHKITLASLLYSAWGLLLQRYNNSDDVMFGTTVSGRAVKVPGIRDIVGMFINTIPLRVQTHSNERFVDMLHRIDKALQSRQEHEAASLVKIKEYSEINSNEELFDTVVIIENYPIDLTFTAGQGKLSVKSYRMIERPHYDLTVEIMTFDHIELVFAYNNEMLSEETIVSLAGHFKCITENVIENPSAAIVDYEILSERETNQIIYEFNKTDTDYTKHSAIHELFEQQAEKSNSKIAVVYEDKQLTYGELNDKANRLSQRLKKAGIGKGDIVAFMLPRSLDMVIAILGILKANAACLPINVTTPGKRVVIMLRDCNTQVLVKQKELSLSFAFSGTVIDMDEGCEQPGVHILEEEVVGDGIYAYIIYTSGSTGTPKGVSLTHRGIINHALTKIMELQSTAIDIFCFNLSISFVASIWQIFAPFFIGAKLVIYSGDTIIDAGELLEHVVRDNVTLLEIVPSLLNAYFEPAEPEPEKIGFNRIGKLVLTGEKVMPSLVNKYYKKYETPLINAYGQSECSDDTLHYHIPFDTDTTEVPVGKPSNNTRIYILNRDLRLQPVNVPGELYIWGDGLAQGYLNRPELSAEKFVPNPFMPGQMMFKTGDFGKWTPHGNIGLLGRTDHQVKVRGHRLELGEVENHLLSHEEVNHAVAVVKEFRGENRLCAYFVSETHLTVPALREYLRDRLPDYMIPSYFVELGQLPLNSSGKVNRSALPEPTAVVSGDEYIAPGDIIEKKLAEIWAEVLMIEKDSISIDSDFFGLGGHSLKAIASVSKIHKAFNTKVPLAQMFKTPSIKGLAEYIKRAEKTIYSHIEIAEKKEYYLVSSAQKRLYIIQQTEPGNISYNMLHALSLDGDIDADKLEMPFKKLIARHESLRTSFEMVDDEWVQIVHDRVEFGIHFFEDGVERTIKNFVRPFDLARAPLIRAALVKKSRTRYILIIDMHHIITDGVSQNLLKEEFISLYTGKELPPLKFQYKDYSEWENSESQRTVIKQQEEYWLNKLSGGVPVLNLETDYPRPAVQDVEGSSMNFTVDGKDAAELKAIGTEKNVDLFMVLLTIFNILLFKLSKQEDIIVGTVVAGRNNPDLEQIVGFFVNFILLRNYPSGEKRFMDFLNELKLETLEAFDNQEYPFVDLVSKVEKKRDLSRHPLSDVGFTFENALLRGERNDQGEGKELKITSYYDEDNISSQDLILLGHESKGQLVFTLKYGKKLFKEKTIAGIINSFKKIISSVIEDPGRKLKDIEIISVDESNNIRSNIKKAREAVHADFNI